MSDGIPDFIARAIEAQGKVTVEEIAERAALVDLSDVAGSHGGWSGPEPEGARNVEQESFDLPPLDEGQALGYMDEWIPE